MNLVFRPFFLPAFQCPYPGCQRKFNVNSNMRRHWRNHLTNNRRRDAVARLVDPTAPSMPPTPPLSSSPTDTPISQFSGSLPSPPSASSTTLPSRSSSPTSAYNPSSENEDAMHIDHRAVTDDDGNEARRRGTGPYAGVELQTGRAAAAAAFAVDRDASVPGLSNERRRLRSRSSPVPLFHDESGGTSAYAHAQYARSGPSRARSSSCNVPGCGCQPVSTTLRPAFPSSSMRSSKSTGNP